MKKAIIILGVLAAILSACGMSSMAKDKEEVNKMAVTAAEEYCKGRYVTADKYAVGGVKSCELKGTEATVKLDVVVTEPGAGAPTP